MRTIYCLVFTRRKVLVDVDRRLVSEKVLIELDVLIDLHLGIVPTEKHLVLCYAPALEHYLTLL